MITPKIMTHMFETLSIEGLLLTVEELEKKFDTDLTPQEEEMIEQIIGIAHDVLDKRFK